ncbi:MAG TPA: hypothetical protein VLR51_08430, partial [Actinomycetes bacterium]|nr:hypothetical protein [Actinomycetes bacterium]
NPELNKRKRAIESRIARIEADHTEIHRARERRLELAEGDIDAKVALRIAGLTVTPPGGGRTLLTIDRLAIAAGDRVAILEARLTGTNTGPVYLGGTDRLILGTTAEALPATGRAMDIAGTVVLEFDGGHVTAERHYWPAIDILVQLGLVG